MFHPGTSQPALIPGQSVQVNKHQVQVERYLSQGGYALVYIVTTRESINKCTRHVLKRIIAPDESGLKDVQNEVQVMRRLQGHPNIVHLIDSSWQRLPDYSYEILILMELCPGGGIIDMMNRRLRERLTEAEILQVFVDVCEAVAFMHSRKPPILHRDLKVENILQSTPNSYKLCDFGSASGTVAAPHTQSEIRSLENDLNKHTTLQYRAPEMVDLLLRRRIDEKSDIWALGVLLYKLCFYTTPFEEHGPIAILTVQYKIPAYPVYSQGLVKLVASMLREHGVQRPSIFSLLQSVHNLRGTKSCSQYSEGDKGNAHTFLSPRPVQREAQIKSIDSGQTDMLQIPSFGGKFTVRPSRSPVTINSNQLYPKISALRPPATNRLSNQTGQYTEPPIHPAESLLKTLTSPSPISDGLTSTTKLTDSFGESFGATRPDSPRHKISAPFSPGSDSLAMSLSPSLLKGGKTGGFEHDAFKGLDGLSLRGLSITGPGRSAPIAPSRGSTASLKPLSPYYPPYRSGSSTSQKSTSPQTVTEGLPAELRYPPVDDVDALSTQKSTYQTRTATHFKSLAKLPFIEPGTTQPNNFRSEHITVGATGPSTSVRTNHFTSPTSADSAVQAHTRPSSRYTTIAGTNELPRFAPEIAGPVGGTSPSFKSIYAPTRNDSRTSPLLPNQVSDIVNAKPPLDEPILTRAKQRSGVHMKTDSSSDDEGPENPVKHYHSGVTITASSSAPKRARKSSVHNLVDFYESGPNPKVQSHSEIRSPKENAPVSVIERLSEDLEETTVKMCGHSSLPPKVKAKRPQSMLVTSPSFGAGGVAEFQKESRISPITSPKLREHIQSAFISGRPIQPRSGEPVSSEYSIDHDVDSRRKPPTNRSLVELLEADTSKQKKPTMSRGDSSPERAFRGVGDLIQRWQNLSQNK